jgi:hypothetical protein
LKGDQIEVLVTIPSVDPPNQALSEPSVAVIDDYGFTVLHLYRPPGRTIGAPLALTDTE